MEFAIDAEVRGLKQCRTEDEECGPNVKLSRTGSLSLCRQEDSTGNATDQDSGVLQDPQLIMYNQQLQQMRHLQSYAYGNALKQSHFASSGHLQQQQLFPFTASQWAELEHQALIFKYMMARAPVPPELVVPIRRSLILSPHTNTWSGFQLGVSSGSPMDAEPGRCRRTDGKKWRCSRPVVADQKYCERHMHRGRNRSRKAAEAAAANNGTAKASFHSEKQQQSAKSSGSFNSGIESGLSHYGSQLAASKDQRFVSNDLHPEQLLFSEVSGSCTRRLGAGLPYLSQSYSSSMIPTSSLFQPGLKQVEAPLRHFFDDWPRSKNNQSPWSCEEQGIVNGGLKLGLEEDEGKANSASAREEEEEDTYRMSGGSDLLADVLKTSSGSDYQRKKLVLASPTGVLQKVTCFSDSSSSASSPGSVKNTHAD